MSLSTKDTEDDLDAVPSDESVKEPSKPELEQGLKETLDLLTDEGVVKAKYGLKPLFNNTMFGFEFVNIYFPKLQKLYTDLSAACERGDTPDHKEAEAYRALAKALEPILAMIKTEFEKKPISPMETPTHLVDMIEGFLKLATSTVPQTSDSFSRRLNGQVG